MGKTIWSAYRDFISIDVDLGDSWLLNKKGFNNYLKFLIAITWEKYSNSSLNNNYIIIRNINETSVLWTKVNTTSWFKPFWQKLINLWIFTDTWAFNFQNAHNLREIFRNPTKQQKTEK